MACSEMCIRSMQKPSYEAVHRPLLEHFLFFPLPSAFDLFLLFLSQFIQIVCLIFQLNQFLNRRDRLIPQLLNLLSVSISSISIQVIKFLVLGFHLI